MKFNPAPILEIVRQIKDSISPDVVLIAAVKTRSLEEVEAVIQAGVTHIGYNYIQEAIPIIQSIGTKAEWHMIGHLQRNKAKIAVQNFDMIETVDSLHLAQKIDRYCEQIHKIMPVLVEINSGREANKTGVLPEEVDDLIQKIAALANIHIEGLMTMGPRFGNPEDARPYFKIAKDAYERIAVKNLPNVNMRFLSMGMSNSYQIAIEEGANIIRIGTKIFGQRQTNVKYG
jgi:pyridoxal phosphate enzyme (YggS family)